MVTRPPKGAVAGQADNRPLSRAIVFMFAVAGGLAVANVYYAHPLLDIIAADFGISHAAIGLVVTWTQIGYGFGLLFLVPLGDLLDRRRLIAGQFLLLVLALAAISTARSGTVLLAAMMATGLLAAVAQTIVAYAASLARDDQRGAVVGTVTSGIVLGILLARAISGSLSDVFGWRSVYAASAVMFCVMAVLLARYVPRDIQRVSVPYFRLIGSVPLIFWREPLLLVRGTLAMLIFAAITILWTPMVLPLSAPPHLLSHTEIGLFGLAGAMGVIGAAGAGRLADGGKAQRVSGTALSVMLVSWVPAALLPYSLWGLIAAVLMIDCGLQAVHVTNQSLIYRVRPEARSRIAAGYMIFYSAGCAAGSILATLVYARGGWFGVCALGGATSAAALLFWAATRRISAQGGG